MLVSGPGQEANAHAEHRALHVGPAMSCCSGSAGLAAQDP